MTAKKHTEPKLTRLQFLELSYARAAANQQLLEEGRSLNPVTLGEVVADPKRLSVEVRQRIVNILILKNNLEKEILKEKDKK